MIEGKDLPVTTSAKILRVTISDNLKWNDHVLECVKKANKRLFFIVSLNRANVHLKDILDYYCCSIRSVLEYYAPVYHHTLQAYLSEELERVQKRVIKILAQHLSYSKALTIFGLKNRRSNGWEVRRQILSIMADRLTLARVRKWIPSCRLAEAHKRRFGA